ncbi:MmgE/PrpD family protein [Pseudomonas sp. UL073]|uniref:MmgE/PrpD family protein n=1 Tax=Zestomonas insulae TaxID=2809017 RepID=A0ABS2I833_9GAMM|nr:MmgE/PrpD family protein [Pseudomonas insulae]MBM7059306.1 MmgE/PrpD family protein [Pseudomonas insulae]
MSGETLSQALAAFVHELRFADLPAAVRDKARLCVLHQLGMALAGHELPGASIAAELILADGGAAQATVLHGGWRSSAMNAAFANAVLFHGRVQDDTHHTAHLGTVLIAAGLALAEARRSSGEAFMTALVAGYEVAGALSREFTALTTPRGFRATALYGVLGAAAVSARLLGLDRERTAHALGIAATLAGGTIEPFAAGSEEFVLHNGQAARNGILAASLAARGLGAAVSALDGQAGFLRAFAGSTEGGERMLAGLGTCFEILNVNFKALPVCAGNQTPLLNARQLAAQLGATADIVAIDIDMHPFEARHPGIAYCGPFRNRVQTLMSTPFSVALGLLGRAVDMPALHAFDDPAVLRLVACARVHEAPDLAMLQSRIRVRLADGRELAASFYPQADQLRFSWAKEVTLLHGMRAEMPLDAAALDELIAEVGQLEQLTDLSSLVRRTSICRLRQCCHEQ